MKRDDYIGWTEYFMGIAELSAMRSKDPNTQVGCCIVDNRNRILSVGYNGLPAGCSDDEFPWYKNAGDAYDCKHSYVVHSELNAILNFRGETLAGSRLYVTMFPCNECAKAIIQAGIREVIYRHDDYLRKPSGQAALRMFEAAEITCRKYIPTDNTITLDL